MARDTVDTRVVRMEFDNKQFEKNIKQTSKSLDNFKRDLDFKGVGNSLEKITVKFSAFQVAATALVVNLTNKIISLGTTIVKSLSVDNMSAGWAKFGEKTTSVATMMAQKIRIAGREITDLAEKTAIVTEQLELLTWFSDETSYSFTDMVNNVGKFTAAGQDLDTSVKAMEGIATWAALSGQNAQTASRAMYQLAQAMGKGKIQKIDWMSIQNANMDTEEFRETILATAVAMGQLTKEGDKFVTKTGKKFTQSQFADFLSEGWFTSDVLVKGLNKYSAAVDQIYAIANREGITASEVIEKYGDQLDAFGVKAFKAAQEARTFRDVINSVKDAVSSKWMTTFENIFGNQEEAVKLWTDLANRLYDAFAESGNFRNNVLSIWKEMGGREDIFGENGAFWNLYNAIKAIKDLIKEAWRTIFPISELEEDVDQAKDIARNVKQITENINNLTKKLTMSTETSERLSKIFKAIFSVLKVGLVTIQAIRYTLEPLFYTLKQLATKVLDKILYYTGGIENIIIHIVNIANKLRDSLWNVIDIINPDGVLNVIFDFISKIFKTISDYKPISRLTRFIENLFNGLRDGGGTTDNLIRIFQGLLSIVSILGKTFIQVFKVILKYVLPVLDKIVDAISYLVGFISGLVISITAAIMDIFTVINRALEGGKKLSDVGDSIKDFLSSIPKALQQILPILKSVWIILKSLIDVILLLPRLLNAISVRLTGRGILDNLIYFFDNFSKIINEFVDNIKNKKTGKTGSFTGLVIALTYFFEGLYEILKGLLASAQMVLTILGSVLKVIGIALQRISDVFIKIFTGRWDELTKTQKAIIKTVAILGTIILALYMLWSIFWRIVNLINPIGAMCDSLTGLLDKIGIASLMSGIHVLSSALLRIAVSFYIFNKVDKELIKTVVYLAAVVSVIAVILYFIKDMTYSITVLNKGFERAKEEVKDAKKESSGMNRALRDFAKVITSIANMMLKLAVVALIFDKLDPEKDAFHMMLSTLLVVSTFAVILMLVLNATRAKMSKSKDVSKDKSFLKFIGVLAGLFTILKLVAKTMLMFETISDEAFRKGMMTLVGVSASLVLLLSTFAVFVSVLNKKAKTASKKGPNVVKTMLALALVVAAIGITMSELIAGILALTYIPDQTKLIAPIIIITSLLGEIVAMLMILSKAKVNIKSTSAMILLLAGVVASAQLLAASLIVLSKYPATKMLAASAILQQMLSAIVGVSILLSKQKANINRTRQSIMKVVAISLSLIPLAQALALVSTISFGSALGALTILETLLISLVGISALLAKVKATRDMGWLGVGLMSLSAGILSLAQALFVISKVDLKSTGQGLLIVGGALLVIVAAGYAAQSVIGVIVLLSTAVLLLSTALLLFSYAAILLTNSIDDLAGKGESLKAFFSAIGSGFAEMIKTVIVGVTEAVSQSLLIITQNIFDLIDKAIKGIIRILEEDAIPLAAAVVNVVIGILENIANNADRIFSIVGRILMALINFLLDFIAKNVPGIIDKLVDVVHVLIENFIKNLPKILTDITNLVLAIIDIIADIVVTFADKIVETLLKVMLAIWNSLMKMFGAEAGEMTLEEFREMFMPVMELIKTILNLIGAILKELTPIINKIVQAIVKLFKSIDFEKVLGFIAKVLGVIADIISWLAPLIADILNPVLDIVFTVLSAILDVLEPIIKFLNDNLIGPILEGLCSVLQMLAGVLDMTLGPALKTILEFFGALIQSFSAVINGDWDQLGQIWSNFGQKILNIWSGFKDKWCSFWDNFWEENQESLKTAGRILLGIVTLGLSEIGFAIYNNWDEIKKFFTETIPQFFTEIVPQFFSDIWENIKTWFVNIWDGIKEWWGHSKIKEFFDRIGQFFTQDIPNFFSNLWSQIGNKFSEVWNNIKNWWSQSKIKEFFDRIGQFFTQTIPQFFSDLWNRIKSACENLWNNIINNFKSFFGIHSPSKLFEEGGEYLMQGLINGIKEYALNVLNVIQNTAQSIWDSICNFFGINSPSKLFEECGKELMGQLSDGIQNASDSPLDGIDRVCNEALQSLDSLLDEDEYDYTIKVGMDISAVEKQSENVRDLMSSISTEARLSQSPYGYNASRASSEISINNKEKASSQKEASSSVNTTNSNNTTLNNTFNIKSTDPREAAEEIDKILQERAINAKLARGGI